jgi:predicted transcriptional regulator
MIINPKKNSEEEKIQEVFLKSQNWIDEISNRKNCMGPRN